MVHFAALAILALQEALQNNCYTNQKVFTGIQNDKTPIILISIDIFTAKPNVPCTNMQHTS